jgi:NADH-quinone oxidoreductase subunit J
MLFNSFLNSSVVGVLAMGPSHTPEAVLFWFMAPLAVLAALGAVFAKKAVHSALFIAWIMVSLAIFYVAEGALFLGIVQVVVYTGAVMMLFLFILMLVGVDTSDSLVETIKGQKVSAILVGVGIGGLLTSLIGRALVQSPAIGLDAANIDGNVQGVAGKIFSEYVWAFEVLSALLITAALGAMVLAYHQKVGKKTQKELSAMRFRGDSLATAAGLPASGTYALHNAVDVPALLPDGSPSDLSVSATLEARRDIISSKPFIAKKAEEIED